MPCQISSIKFYFQYNLLFFNILFLSYLSLKNIVVRDMFSGADCNIIFFLFGMKTSEKMIFFGIRNLGQNVRKSKNIKLLKPVLTTDYLTTG